MVDWLISGLSLSVIPAPAGIQPAAEIEWIPAFAGMTNLRIYGFSESSGSDLSTDRIGQSQRLMQRFAVEIDLLAVQL
jgi:hypothetical protein